jgi:hypothetical protein
MKPLASVLLLTLVGCASSPGVVPAGQDTYMVARSGYGLGESQSNVMSKIFKEASDHCAAQGKALEPIDYDSKPGWPGHFPEAELKFRCVTAESR